MRKNKYTFIAMILVSIFGIVLFTVGTDGFTAFTAETARVNQLIENQPNFPDVTLEDSSGEKYTLAKFKDQYVFITFIYTECTTVCLELEFNMSQVYDQIPKEYLGKDITFLSISFDPERDTPEKLTVYRESFGSDGETWRMARIPNQAELDGLLKEFGVIVIPDDYGNFTHNSAFYLVNPNGKLVDVMDYKDIDGAATKLMFVLEGEGSR